MEVVQKRVVAWLKDVYSLSSIVSQNDMLMKDAEIVNEQTEYKSWKFPPSSYYVTALKS